MKIAFKLAFRNMTRRLRKTLLLAGIVAVGMAVLFVANSVFETTDSGMKISFVKSFTGDFSLAVKSEEAFGIFGNETPIVSELSSIPVIEESLALEADIRAIPGIDAACFQVSGAGLLQVGGWSVVVPVFGVDPEAYFKVCSDITLETGSLFKPGSSGILINSSKAAQIELSISRPLKIGEDILLSMYSQGSFRIRKAKFSGIYSYKAPQDTLNRIVLVDPVLVRGLCGVAPGVVVSQSGSDGSPSNNTGEGSINSFDSMFSGVGTVTASDDPLSLKGVEALLADTAERDAMLVTDDAAWHFLLVKIREGTDVGTVRKAMEALTRERYPEVRILDWRETAGISAQALFAVRLVFLLGMAFLLIGAAVIIMNALVISVFERTSEIGTMRAVGAGKGFVCAMFMAETFSLTFLAGLAGICVGWVLTVALARNGIVLENQVLVSLFGGSVVKPVPSLRSAAVHLLAAAGIGAVAWIYPVFIALKIKPEVAMRKG